MPTIKKDPFNDISFWFKVLKISLMVFVPYWLFGIEAGILVGIVLICLFLSKISLTILEMHESRIDFIKDKSNKLGKSKTQIFSQLHKMHEEIS
jgi:hypothetical protein